MTDTQIFQVVVPLLEETFERHHGIYLYPGTSLLDTLADVTAEEASRPLPGDSGTLAAQVEHVAFYIEVMLRAMRGEDVEGADWEEIWQRVGAVSEDEWTASRDRLKETYQRLAATVRAFDSWSENRLWVLSVVAHSAYHLGVIRLALAGLRATA